MRRFYFAVRTVKGERYSKSAYKNLRAGIQRHLAAPPHNKTINLTLDKEFHVANQVYAGYLSKIREEGRDVSTHKEALKPGDVEKLYEQVFVNTPKGLQKRIFFEIHTHFARRGREGMRDLRKDSFVIKVDENGDEYVVMAYHEKEKTKRGVNMKEKERECAMYAVSNDSNCPVRHLKIYLEKLNPKCDAFYQRPMSNPKPEGPWYENCPVGKNKLNDMMKTMSIEGGLSQVYTNHCLRNTCVNALEGAGYEVKDIMRVTGHKHQASLAPYLGKPSTEKVKSMSNAIHQYRNETQGKTCTITSVNPNTCSLLPVENNNILQQNAVVTLSNSMQLEAKSLFTGAVFNNCTFNFPHK